MLLVDGETPTDFPMPWIPDTVISILNFQKHPECDASSQARNVFIVALCLS